MWAMIATWRMALEGLSIGAEILDNGGASSDAIEKSIKEVEDFPYYKSVGYGGLPNEQGEVELDAAYMDGDSLGIGAVAGIKNFKNPISLARSLSKEEFNCLLVGKGGEEYGEKNGFEKKDMLTDRAKILYENRKKEIREKGLSPYDGHDTVGMVALDQKGKLVVGTSTSGLFMKKRGRVGDSPISGSGFYVDSEIGGAVATGLGEDLMKGCISYEIVRLMGEGLKPMEACEKAVWDLDRKLKKRRGKSGDISVVCLDKYGEFGVGSNIEEFSFVLAREGEEPLVYVSTCIDGKNIYEKASRKWMEEFMAKKLAPVYLK